MVTPTTQPTWAMNGNGCVAAAFATTVCWLVSAGDGDSDAGTLGVGDDVSADEPDVENVGVTETSEAEAEGEAVVDADSGRERDEEGVVEGDGDVEGGTGLCDAMGVPGGEGRIDGLADNDEGSDGVGVCEGVTLGDATERDAVSVLVIVAAVVALPVADASEVRLPVDDGLLECEGGRDGDTPMEEEGVPDDCAERVAVGVPL